MPIAWETHATPAMGERAQEIVNKRLVRDSDILVAVFWTRVGTPTGQAAGGTIEEVEKHLQAGKPAMLYFSSAPIRPDSVDDGQYRSLKQFRDSCRQRGLVEEYESVSQFREKFSRHLAQTLIQHFPPSAHPEPSGGDKVELRDPLANLSKEARQLVQEAALDANGSVLMVETLGGMSVETNRRNFVQQRNARSEAKWRSVIRELTQNGLLESRDLEGQVFSITDEGYRAADLLARGAA